MDSILSKGEDLFKYVPQFYLDENGRFKYILIQLKFKDEILYFVRGEKKYNYHMENFEKFALDLRNCGLKFDQFEYEEEDDNIVCKVQNVPFQLVCVGGGRVEISQEKKSLFIYGYSQSFGRADHTIALEISKQHLSNFPQQNFTWSNEGY
ncbi:hypothetical protein ABPG72_020820 [Tetrahymena utriculariae]